MPVYGVQWHPERPQFEWSKRDAVTGQDPINHDFPAIVSMQAFGNFFAEEARHNNHTFASEEALDEQLIYNYVAVGPSDYRAYFFKPTGNGTRS